MLLMVQDYDDNQTFKQPFPRFQTLEKRKQKLDSFSELIPLFKLSFP